jgi:hypothetical protein
MKRITLFAVAIAAISLASCSSKNCKECTNCATKPNERLCEEDFEKTSDFNDKLEDMASDGCYCADQ